MSPEVIGAIVMALEAIIGFILLEPKTSKNHMRQFGERILHSVRPLFSNKHSVGIIIALWTTGLAIGMASYSSAIPKDFFGLSYALLAAAIVWSVGYFWSSSFLVNKRVENHNGRGYKAWVVVIPALIMSLGVFCIVKIHSIQIARDLLEMNGVLLPADDPDPPTPCRPDLLSENTLRLYFGGMTAITEFDRDGIISFPHPRGNDHYDPVLLGIERSNDGTIALHANIVDREQKVVALIDRYQFKIGRNRMLDPLSPPRTDKSTIVLTDEYGNDLKIRLMNKHSISFEGELYFRPGEYIQIDENGLALPVAHQRIAGGICFGFSRPGQTIF